MKNEKTITIKIESLQEPDFISSLRVSKHELDTGNEISRIWISTIETDDYAETKLFLESKGYKAYPKTSNEIDSKEYTIFRMVPRYDI